jgi:hypothetical protein
MLISANTEFSEHYARVVMAKKSSRRSASFACGRENCWHFRWQSVKIAQKCCNDFN